MHLKLSVVIELNDIEHLKSFFIHGIVQQKSVEQSTRNFQFVGLLIDRKHLVLYVLVVSENILKKIKIIYISHLD